MRLVGDLFAQDRPLDRRIEGVIKHAPVDEAQLAQEIAEYEVTPSVARGLRTFLEAFDEGVTRGGVTGVGVWVSGFFGSGKSSFAKYLALALDQHRTIEGEPFYERFALRIASDPPLADMLRRVAREHKTSAMMVDLSTEPLAESTGESVANILYHRVLKQLGFSHDKKVADLELRLMHDGRLEEFQRTYAERFPGMGTWTEIHNDSFLAVLRASQLVPDFYGDEYRDPADFRRLKHQPLDDVRQIAQRLIDLLRRQTESDHLLFFVDGFDPYVALRRDRISNVDELVRALHEVGKGRVWFVAIAQQSPSEMAKHSALHAKELFKLKDRFPTAIALDATDIREVVANRLLGKNPEGERLLRTEWKARGELLQRNTHLHDWPGGATPLDADTFAKLYPFLPSRLYLVLDLIQSLARHAGAPSVRAAIRVVQDMLINNTRVLAQGALAERPLFRLATIEDMYDVLRLEIQREDGQTVAAVDRILQCSAFARDELAIRAAKAVAALQPLERPRTAENIAALLHDDLGAPSAVDSVRKALQRIVDAKELGLVEQRADAEAPGGAGFLFLSDEVQRILQKRDAYWPRQAEQSRMKLRLLGKLFEPVPETHVEGTKLVQAGIRHEKGIVAGESAAVLFQLDEVEPGALDARVAKLESETSKSDDFKSRVFWVFVRSNDVDERVLDICRFTHIQSESARLKGIEKSMSNDVQRLLRSEEVRAERAREAVSTSYARALLDGVFVFRGRKRPVRELGTSVLASATVCLQEVACQVFEDFRLIKEDVPADTAVRFLNVPHSNEMPKERDPLGLVQREGNRSVVDIHHPALRETLRAFREKVVASGSGRVQGSALLELFNAPPYGWSKDTTRYLFAALLKAGEVEIHTGEGVQRTAGPRAVEALRNTRSFNRAGVAPRGEPVPRETLDRASRRLETMFGEEVLPLEDQIGRVVRAHFPAILERTASLPERLRLLGLQGEPRARSFLETCADLLKEDARGAASMLGGIESSIPTDETWASGIVKILNGGGERDIRAARVLLDRIAELAELFPAVAELRAHPAITTLEEVLGSDAFHERIADLRDAHRALLDAVRSLYRTEREGLLTSLLSMRQRIEERPSWSRLREEDRAEIAVELIADLREDPSDPSVMLQEVLTRRLGLAGLEERLVRWVDQRVPPEPTSAYARTAPPQSGEDGMFESSANEPVPEAVPIEEILTEKVLTSPTDVDRWIGDLRARLIERVQIGPIRITRGR